jgi:hypothetical protein
LPGRQSETAELIGMALKQQGDIMSEQFRFERKVEASAERQTVFRLALDVRAKLRRLNSRVSKIQLANYRNEEAALVRQDFDALGDTILPCMEALVTSVHLTTEEKKYFLSFVEEVDDLKLTNEIRADINSVMSLEKKYKHFGAMLMKVAQPQRADSQDEALTS